MTHHIAGKLDSERTLLLAAAGFASILFGLANAPQANAQPQAAVVSPPVFDVASIKPNTGGGSAGTRFDPTGVNIRRTSLLDLISTAYRIPWSLVSTEPRTRELFASRYDVVATAEHEVSRDQLLMMLQTLLVDRFKLTAHREKTVRPVYKLVIAKGGPKLRESMGTQARDQSCALPQCMSFNNTDMWSFAGTLAGRMGRPVLDLTGLQGPYDFTLRLDVTEGLATDDPGLKDKSSDWSFSSIVTDIEKQLGLRLESDKASVETLVVDHAERPSGN